MSRSTFYGKYRGTVVNNVDPLMRGRVQVSVADVPGASSPSWAMPCVPVAGPSMGMFVVPPIGASVWVEFEAGDSDRPICVGGFWNTTTDVPEHALTGPPAAPNVVVQTSGQHAVVLSDLPGPGGGILLRSPTGASIRVDDTGIYIDNGKGASIVLAGPSVTVNNGALVVT